MNRAGNRSVARMPYAALLVRGIRDGDVFQILNNRTHLIRMRWLIHNSDLLHGQQSSDDAEEFLSVLLRPEIYIESVKLIQVLCFISRVKGRQIPFLCINGARAVALPAEAINGYREQTWVSVRVVDVDSVQV